MRPFTIRREKRKAKKKEIFHGMDFHETDPQKPKIFIEKVHAKKAIIEAEIANKQDVYLCPSCIKDYYLGQLARTRLDPEGKYIKAKCHFCGIIKLCETRRA